MTVASTPAPILRPGSGRWPVLLSVTHAGTAYSDTLLAGSRHGRRSLEVLEDPLVDRLIWRAAALGVAAVVAQAPRALIDCNRGPLEMDSPIVDAVPGHDPGPRARGGLGLVPTRTPRHGELWHRPPSRAELQRRLDGSWEPFHRMIEVELEQLRRRHGEVLLLDVHSMPARAAALPRLVVGDRHGQSASRWTGDLVGRIAREAGTSAGFNDPYAGGYVVERHGRPAAGVHALQLEIDRACYLGSDGRSPGAGFEWTAQLVARITEGTGQELLRRQSLLQAAE